MKRRKYKIADILFNVSYESCFNDKIEFPFLFDESDCDLPCVNINFKVDLSLSKESLMTAIYGKPTSEGNLVYLSDKDGKVAHKIIANHSWDEILVYSSFSQILPFFGSVGEVIFRTSILLNYGFVIHASAIDFMNNGILFSAPSGTGKSTQSMLWVKHMGAQILNDDRPAIRLNNGLFNVYGTPWSGTTRKYLNRCVSLTAIILIEQSKENHIIKLNKDEAVRHLIPRCYIPYYDKFLVTKAFENIGNIIDDIPVFLLKCRPDTDAVKLVYDTVLK